MPTLLVVVAALCCSCLRVTKHECRHLGPQNRVLNGARRDAETFSRHAPVPVQKRVKSPPSPAPSATSKTYVVATTGLIGSPASTLRRTGRAEIAARVASGLFGGRAQGKLE